MQFTLHPRSCFTCFSGVLSNDLLLLDLRQLAVLCPSLRKLRVLSLEFRAAKITKSLCAAFEPETANPETAQGSPQDILEPPLSVIERRAFDCPLHAMEPLCKVYQPSCPQGSGTVSCFLNNPHLGCFCTPSPASTVLRQP